MGLFEQIMRKDETPKLYGYVSNDNNPPSYDDILQSNLSQQEKVNAIKQRGQAYNDEQDRQLRNYLTKQYAGAALQIGSAAIPAFGVGRLGFGLAKGLISQVGKKIAQEIVTGGIEGGLSGAVEGFGRGLMNNDNPLKNAATDALAGLGLGTVGGYAGGKIGQHFAKRGLAGNPEAQLSYFDDYYDGLSNDVIQNKGLINEIRQLKSGNYRNTTRDILYNEADDDILDLTGIFDNKVTPRQVKKYIEYLAQEGAMTTKSPDYLIDVPNKNINKRHIQYKDNWENMPKEAQKRHNALALKLKEMIGNSKHIGEPKENTKKDLKPMVDKYHYFKVKAKVGDEIIPIILDTEQLMGESTVKPQTVHLYNFKENK